MTEEEWVRFVAGDGPEIRRVCRLRRAVAEHLESDTDRVLIRRDYAHKLVYKHRVSPYHLPLLPIVIEHGVAIDDKPLHVTFVFDDRHVSGRSWKATVKTNRARTEVFVATFHKLEAREASRKVKSYKIITM